MNFIRRLGKSTYKYRRGAVKTTLSFYHWRDKIPYLLGLKKALPQEMPDFVIAGLPKCGTVWLVDVLKQHSRFNYVKNPFYTDKHEIRFFSFNFDKPIKKYFKAFKNQHPNLISFEKSPDYSTMSISRIRLIKKLNPTIKIILIFRNPVDRAFSNAKMDLIRKKDVALTPQNNYLFFRHYDNQLRRYDYEKILKKWWCVFPKEQILILSLEDIKASPKKVLNKVFDFFEVEQEHRSHKPDLNEAKNVTRASSIPKEHKDYIQKQIPEIMEFWNKNDETFRLD